MLQGYHVILVFQAPRQHYKGPAHNDGPPRCKDKHSLEAVPSLQEISSSHIENPVITVDSLGRRPLEAATLTLDLPSWATRRRDIKTSRTVRPAAGSALGVRSCLQKVKYPTHIASTMPESLKSAMIYE